MQGTRPAFLQFSLRLTACHMLTYTLAGMAAYSIFDYKTLFEQAPLAGFMRPISSPWIAAGPGLQVIRGLLFAVVLYPFCPIFLDGRRGWLKLWGLLAGLAVLGTAGPSPGSLEGFIYTTLTPLQHLRGLPEVLLQTLLFSALLIFWYRRPRPFLNWIMGIAVAVILLMAVPGAVLPRPERFR